MQSILVGYREGADAKRALERAIELAAALGAELVVAAVAPTHEDLIGAAPMAVIPDDRAGDRAIAEAERALDEARQRLQREDATYELVTVEGRPADALVELADARDVDLIVVGTREPGFLDRLLHGSVSRDVSHKTHKDVLIVHP